jgi:hypothetical protein
MSSNCGKNGVTCLCPSWMEKPIRWTYANFYKNWSTCKNKSTKGTNSLIGATPAHFLVAWQSTLWRLMVGSSAGNFLQLAYARALGLFFEIPPSVLT